jgi:hypothetical protein
MKTKLPSFVTILILTLVTSLAWVAFSVYRAIALKPSPVVPKEISQPITPTLDSNTINSLQSKLYFDDSQVPEISPTK